MALNNNILCKLFLPMTFLNLSAAVDTLFPNQTIGIGQTLVSENQIFEMGIFRPEKSPNRYLGIWYKTTPDVVVWVANRNNPITNSSGVTFGISRNGSLAISSARSIIWTPNPSAAASNPALRLLDTGNLVVVADYDDQIWQSFDYPTDTWLPGMKMTDEDNGSETKYMTSWRNPDDPSPEDFVFRIENQGLPGLVILNGTTKTFRTGKWNGRNFNSFVRFPNSIFKSELDIREGKLRSMSRPYDSSVLTRSKLDASGINQ